MSVDTALRCTQCGTSQYEVNADSEGVLLCLRCYERRSPRNGQNVASSYPRTLRMTGKTTAPETAAQSQNDASYPAEAAKTSSDRYAGRLVDLDALLAKPPKPIPWRVQDVVA